MAQNTIDKILQEYEDLRRMAADRRKKRIEAVYREEPRLGEISRKISEGGMNNARRILGDPENADRYNQEYKALLDQLKAEKERIVREAGIDPDFEEYQYQCPLCQDTGYIDNQKCKCFIQRQINEAYLSSNMGELLEKQNFDTFSFDYYSRVPVCEGGKSVYERMKDNYDICRSFCRNFEKEEKGFLFYGLAGLGKTFLSSCIAKEMIDRGYTVLYTRATKLFSMYEDYKFNRTDSAQAEEMLQRVYDSDLLIIDDLGTEFQNKNTTSFLFDLINDRTAKGKKMIISTNHDPNELSELYSSRFTSRIFEFFNPLPFVGEDIRVQKKMME